MAKNSLHKALEEQLQTMSERYLAIIAPFLDAYVRVARDHNASDETIFKQFSTFLTLMKEQIEAPHKFEPYHEQVRTPFDYYQFGVDFLTPLVDHDHSTVTGHDNLKQIEKQLRQKDNVIFLANHQIEGDPQAMSILLDKTYPFARETIFVAGERVITDPLAIPFSMGRNLLCIYSKRYIDNPPEQKSAKQQHNKRTMQLMSDLLAEGGHSIYVAPSGGRDRPGPDGRIEIAPFDPQSIEMFYLMAKKAAHPTHFYPLTLATYSLLPPPQTIQVELGEARTIEGGAIHLSCGAEIDMESFPGSDLEDKQERRAARATYIHSLVKADYEKFPLEH